VVLKKLFPDSRFESIYDIDLGALKSHGISALILDLDNTIVARNSFIATAELKQWLELVREQGFKACIVSNNWKQRVSKIAGQVNLPLVARAAKPWPMAFTRAMQVLGTGKEETAVIGDQIFTDILGGNLAGLRTILVVPLSNSEAVHTKVLRHMERWVIARWNRHIEKTMEQK
jgi:hypothetical protein